jgi:hypothetical protein
MMKSSTPAATMNAPTVETMLRTSHPICAEYVCTRRGIPASPVMCIGKNATLKPTNMRPNTHLPRRSLNALRLMKGAQ